MSYVLAWSLASLLVAAAWGILRTIDDAVTARCLSGRPSSGAPDVPTTARAAHDPRHLRLLGPDAAGPRPRAGAARRGARHHATGVSA